MRQRIICSVVLTWICVYIEAQCPTEISCAGINECYMLFSTSNDWYFKNPDGQNKNIGGNPPASASKYIYIPVAEKLRSLPDVEGECLQAGANIVIINDNLEYEQLTENLLHILKFNEDSIFNVKVNSLPQKYIYDTCGEITVDDGFFGNDVRIVASRCSKQNRVNSIICESTDDLKCPASTTVKPTEKTTTTSSRASVTTITQTSPIITVISTVANTVQNFTTYEEEHTRQTEQTEQESFVQPLQAEFSNTMMYTLLPVSLVVFCIVTGLTCFVVVRRRNKQRGRRFDSVAIVMRPPSIDDLGVGERESNIYMFPDEVKLEGHVSASIDVASNTVETNTDGYIINATHQVDNRETDNDLKAEGHYTVPKKDAYVCMSNKSDAAKLSKHGDGASTPSAHYNVPRLHAGEYVNAIYQEPSPLGSSTLTGSGQYDTPMHQDTKNIQYVTPKLSPDKYKGNGNDNIYQEPCFVGDTSSFQYDTPKLGVNKEGENGNIYQEPSPLGNGAQSSNDQCDVSRHKKFSKYKQGEKPIENGGTKEIAKKCTISKNKSSKHCQVNQRKDDSPPMNTCEIPVNYEKSRKDKEEVLSHQVSIEHYDIPKGINEYENCDSFMDEQKGSNKTNNNQVSTNHVQNIPNDHYDVPRIANEYEDCGDSITKYLEQKGESSCHVSSNEHYDIPKAANEYETCGNNVDIHPGQEDSNKHYEEVRGEKDGMLKKDSSNRKNQMLSKPKPKPRRQVSKTVKHEYMSYEGESQNNARYQELDKTSMKRMKFFNK
ncbi:uncharacterized protein LOC117116982 [Anneissia japonica]|uniref:uncharacterized protein LOC117116982 n=1 Tax=Anneissia japonica TaxID=1529436 RepID=UPI001425AE9C|nr:uncharacterized protein LOC117116982 [Anneissia japonica]